MTEKERKYLYWLCRIPELGTVSIRRLWEAAGSFEEIFHQAVYNMEEIAAQARLRNGQKKSLERARKEYEQSEEEYAMLSGRKIQFVTLFDADYPEKLKQICDPPMGIFVRGRLPEQNQPSIAVVGARGCSGYGEQIAEEFSRILASEHVQIISGLALGIDGAAHRGALKALREDEHAGRTFGVLGCGVNICYPSSNYQLYEALVEEGGIISEFFPDVKPLARNFPMRNRIISGLADGVLVVEAKERSGSLITAELALDQGREVFAVPGRITDCLSEGCNRLISQGAYLTMSPGEILEQLGVKYRKELIIHEKNVNGLAKKEKMLYSCLDFRPKHLDEILKESGMHVGECMGILMELELGGYVQRSANQYYAKKL